MKKMYTYLIMIGLIVIIVVGIIISSTIIQKMRTNVQRLTANVENADFKIDTLKTKNNELQYSVNTLVVKNKEFKNINSELVEEIDNLKIKLKNVNSVNQITSHYEILYDPVYVTKSTDTTFKASTKDNWSEFSCNIEVCRNTVEVSDVAISLKDTMTLAEEIKYKGIWFWKKPISMTLHIKSENPYFKLDKVQTYYFYKNKTHK